MQRPPLSVASLIGIEGNEKADRLANAALDSDIVELDIGLELDAIESLFADPIRVKCCGNHGASLEIREMRGRHGPARHIQRHDTGPCDSCGVPETVQHFLSECSSDWRPALNGSATRSSCRMHMLESALGNAGVLKYVSNRPRPIQRSAVRLCADLDFRFRLARHIVE
jgi:hypothetical protein